MHSSHQGSGGVYPSVVIITAAFIVLGSFAPGALSAFEPYLVLGMMLLLGLPHGATDHGLFLALHKGKPAEQRTKFYMTYLGLIAAYGAVWYFLPLIAFIIFILLSVYHFGQSNWVSVHYRNKKLSVAHYLLWGTGILMTPILLHSEEAIAIVAAMTSTVIKTPEPASVLIFISIMALANLALVIVLWFIGTLSKKRMVLEILAYALLMGMFFTNSLLLGFTVYFVFWHSLASALDQLQFFKRRLSPTRRRQLYGEIAMTVLGALTFCLIVWFGPGPESALKPSIIGGVFIAISLLTMPHMLLVEQLYTNWSPNKKSTLAPSIEKEIINTNITKPQSVALKTEGKGLTFTH